MITYIIIGIVALLLIVGATQRKQLTMLFKSEVNDLVEKNLNNVKIAKMKIKELKANARKLAEQAAILMGEEDAQGMRLKQLKAKGKELLSEAKKAKSNDNDMLAKEKLKLKREVDKQIKLIEEQIIALTKKRTSLEIIIERSKGMIAEFDIKTKGLESRQAVNNLLGKTVSTDFLGDDLSDNLDNADYKITVEESKLDYLMSDKIEDECYTEDIENEFDKL